MRRWLLGAATVTTLLAAVPPVQADAPTCVRVLGAPEVWFCLDGECPVTGRLGDAVVICSP